ncbi:MAG: hypothetical protein J3K34DRAFT_423898 [Monoraphidium minutum]|nr:MAG: hypothetical protein J3K34DRAFT_423898 [Monoraphidium minutum]
MGLRFDRPLPQTTLFSPQILVDVSKEVARIEAEEAAQRAAEEAAALAAEEAEAAAEAGDYAAPAADWYSEPAAYAAPAAKASGETARVLDALQRSPLMLDLPASSPGLAEIAALDDAMIVASCVLLMRVEGMFDAKEMIKKDASILVDVSKEVARIEAEEAAQRAAEEAAALAEAEAEAAAEAGGYAAPAAYSAPTSGGEVGRVIDAIKRSPLMLELPATSRGLEQVTVLADDMIVASCVLLMRQEGMFDAKEMVRSDASVLVPTAKIVERLEAEEAAARAAEEAAAAEAEEAARAEEAAAASADRVPAFASKAAQAVRPDAGRALDAVRRSPLMLDLPKSTPGVSAIATMSDDAIIDGSLYLLREHGLLDAKAMVAKDAAVLKTAAAAASAAAGVPAASKATISAALDAVRRSPLMTDLTGQEGMEAPTLAAIANMSDTEIIDAALTLVSKYGLEDAKALVGKDAKVLLNPKADHSRLMAELRGAPGAEAVAVAASVAAAAAKSRTANAARPPASKSEAALARAQSRSRESPGLALLAGMSIVWNMMGPLGGLFVKFAQHPAANTKGNRKRMGA